LKRDQLEVCQKAHRGRAGEKVDKHRLTQVERAMRELGVQMIPAYSPQARGRGGGQVDI